jgi:hypothetical protein
VRGEQRKLSADTADTRQRQDGRRPDPADYSPVGGPTEADDAALEKLLLARLAQDDSPVDRSGLTHSLLVRRD